MIAILFRAKKEQSGAPLATLGAPNPNFHHASAADP
jgi:hypothetical protein